MRASPNYYTSTDVLTFFVRGLSLSPGTASDLHSLATDMQQES